MLNHIKRIERLRCGFTDNEIDAMFISQPQNRRYLSGFDGSAGYLLISEKKKILATDFRYLGQAKTQSPDYQIFQISGPKDDWFPSLVDQPGIRRLGFESRDVSFYQYRQLSDIMRAKGCSVTLVAVDGIVELLRAIKEPDEIGAITSAAEISDAAFRYACGALGSGISERDLAWETEKYMREMGSEPLPFDIIVGSGDNSSIPHARPSSRIIPHGEPVVMDFGARIDGYSSDLSRTLLTGEADETFCRVYDTVLCAQLAAIEMIREGMSGEEADSIARTVIEEAGYGGSFGHALGHGIGLLAHEAPRLGKGAKEQLKDGMVFTIEPGIYLPGWGGVRIEDTVVMEGGKVRVISKAEKVGVQNA